MLRELLGTVLAALVPLLERRVLAAERQAAAAERTYDLLDQYLSYSDPQFLDLRRGVIPEAEDLSVPPDVQADHGDARDLKTARLEELRALWYTQHGELLDDERLVVEYERLYEDSEARLDAGREAL